MSTLGDIETLKTEWTGYGNDGETLFIVAMLFGATVYTQITMLNMLIALMGETLAHSMDNRKIFSAKTKLDILREQSAVMFFKDANY